MLSLFWIFEALELTFPLELFERLDSLPLFAGDTGAEMIPSMLSVASWDSVESVGLTKLLRLPTFLRSFSATLIPNFSGLVIGVGGRVILGEPSRILRPTEPSRMDLEREPSLKPLERDLSLTGVWGASPSGWSTTSPFGGLLEGGTEGTRLTGAVTRGCRTLKRGKLTKN